MFAILKVILNALFFNYDLNKAVSEPRLHNQLSPNTTVAEPEFDKVSVTNSKQCWYIWLIAGQCGVLGDNPSTKNPVTPEPLQLCQDRHQGQCSLYLPSGLRIM